jgi:predicted nucleic acid-binding protein
MLILDTSFFCSFYNNFDVNHQASKKLFFDLDDDIEIMIPYVVAAEIAVSKDGVKLLSIAKQISRRFINNNESDLDYVLNIPEKHKNKLKSNDCLILALCKRLDADLLTFDKRLLKVKESLK